MNSGGAPWTPRIAAAQVASEGAGRVLAVEGGLVLVSSRGRTLRASIGGDLLAQMAADPDEAAGVGDRVRLCGWADGRVTVQCVLARALPDDEG